MIRTSPPESTKVWPLGAVGVLFFTPWKQNQRSEFTDSYRLIIQYKNCVWMQACPASSSSSFAPPSTPFAHSWLPVHRRGHHMMIIIMSCRPPLMLGMPHSQLTSGLAHSHLEVRTPWNISNQRQSFNFEDALLKGSSPSERTKKAIQIPLPDGVM